MGGKRLRQKGAEFGVLLGTGLEFDAGIDVFGILAEDHHVHLIGAFHRRRHALEPAHGAQADVQIQDLAQGDVQRANAAADGRGQRAFDGYPIAANGLDGFIGQPGAGPIVGLLPGQDLHPMNLAAPP